MKAIYCQKCHEKKRSIQFGKAYEQLAESLGEIQLVEGCLSACGYGKDKFFLEIDEEFIVADSFDELLQKVEDYDN